VSPLASGGGGKRTNFSPQTPLHLAILAIDLAGELHTPASSPLQQSLSPDDQKTGPGVHWLASARPGTQRESDQVEKNRIGHTVKAVLASQAG
jgi:hypothetical protein